MRLSLKHLVFSLLGLSCLLSSCNRSSGSTWEDTKTLGRYIQRGSKLLFKQNPDSKLIEDIHDFRGPLDDEFIPLNSDEILPISANFSQAEEITSRPIQKSIPSASEVNIPRMESFKEPKNDLATIFKTVHFNTDDHILRDHQYLAVIDNIANYMKKHTDLYVFILGHCDERASETYNLALGTRRASYVRGLLINKGIDANHVFTISFGKEIPLDPGHSQDSWAKNRRAEFKIYEKASATIK
jgi:peptidoglycan-associated lipoprotein